MTEVVIPAVDESNPLALEQAKIITQHLQFIEQRMQLLGSGLLFELKSYAAFGEEILEVIGSADELFRELQLAVGSCKRAIQSEGYDLISAQSYLDKIRSVISHVIRIQSVYGVYQAAQLSEIAKKYSRLNLIYKRSWYKPQGWDPAPEMVPELEELLLRD